jgi:hypothetical protein
LRRKPGRARAPNAPDTPEAGAAAAEAGLGVPGTLPPLAAASVASCFSVAGGAVVIRSNDVYAE